MSEPSETGERAVLGFIDRHEHCEAKLIDVRSAVGCAESRVRLVCSCGATTEAWLAHGDSRQPVTLTARRRRNGAQ